MQISRDQGILRRVERVPVVRGEESPARFLHRPKQLVLVKRHIPEIPNYVPVVMEIAEQQ